MSVTPRGTISDWGVFDPFAGTFGGGLCNPWGDVCGAGTFGGGLCNPWGDVCGDFPMCRRWRSRQGWGGGGVSTSIDWVETDDAHVFKADLPGMVKEDVKVEVEDERTLALRGQRAQEKTSGYERWHRVESVYGSFERRFRLPENAEMDKIDANMENGVLTVTVPKRAGPPIALPRAVDVQ